MSQNQKGMWSRFSSRFSSKTRGPIVKQNVWLEKRLEKGFTCLFDFVTCLNFLFFAFFQYRKSKADFQAFFQAKIFASRSGPYSLESSWFSGKTYSYTIGSRTWPRRQSTPPTTWTTSSRQVFFKRHKCHYDLWLMTKMSLWHLTGEGGGREEVRGGLQGVRWVEGEHGGRRQRQAGPHRQDHQAGGRQVRQQNKIIFGMYRVEQKNWR